MRRISISYADVRRIRIIAILTSAAAHLLLVGILVFLQFHAPEILRMSDLDFRGGGGGGGGDRLKVYDVEFGPQSGNQQQDPKDEAVIPHFQVTRVEPQRLGDEGTPVIRQEKPKKKNRRIKEDRLFGANLPIKHHRGVGPGSGGGMGGGTGGGIGKSSGSSIDWGGTGERRLLSGSIPQYPEGTNKEMSVYLQFTVLPDGSVSSIIPLRKSDELLERASINALRTWRFDPLPPQVEQKGQIGKITFNFKLE